MRGHIAKKHDRYYVVLEHGIDPSTGKRRRTWHPVGTKRREAEQALAELLEQKRTETYVEPRKLTVAQYLVDEWLPVAKHELRLSTFDSYQRNTRLHVVPGIGRIGLQRLRPLDLTKFYAQLLATGRRDGKGGLSPKTVQNIHQMIRKALEDAVQHNYVVRNVAAAAKVPKAGKAATDEMHVWTGEELRSFLSANRDCVHWSAWYLAANTGMRRGEILGLRWRDVDLDAARISVRQAIINVAYKVHRSDVKTQRSQRVVDINSRTVAVLRRQLGVVQGYRAALGDTYQDHDLVFAKPDGSPVHPDTFSKAFDRRVAKTSVPVIRLHDLRHTHATLLLLAGVPPKVVSERLGHATVAFTMQVYAHVIPGMQADAAAAFGDFVFGDDDEGDDTDEEVHDDEE
ncbi:MAG: site-specific integrase [Acidimicrobiales bacterium]|jgi:integrase|nr:site-specific integrase [Acidimicrobiales bacterium]